jgi:hypothetical protein
MSKEAFLLLHSKVKHRITPKHPTKGVNSSGSCVDTMLLFAATIRWLAGGSPWDICFGFHIAYSTLHQHKYDVIASINDALSGASAPLLYFIFINFIRAQATSFFHQQRRALHIWRLDFRALPAVREVQSETLWRQWIP